MLLQVAADEALVKHRIFLAKYCATAGLPPPKYTTAGLPPENFILPLFTDFLGKMLQKCQVLQIFGHKAKHPPLLLKIPNFEKSRYTD